MNGIYIVSGQMIEKGLKSLMDMNSEIRKTTKEMQKISRSMMIDGGPSHLSLEQFIEDMIANIPCKQENAGE